MSIRQAIDQIYRDRQAMDTEVQRLRERCHHLAYRVGWYSWRLGSMVPAKLCQDCDAHLGPPSQAEINAFMAAEKERQREFLTRQYGETEATRILAELPPSDFWSHPLG